MADDLVKRIESKISGLDHELEADLVTLLADAADRIEALEAALRHIATAPVEAGMYPSPAHWLRDIARRALEAK